MPARDFLELRPVVRVEENLQALAHTMSMSDYQWCISVDAGLTRGGLPVGRAEAIARHSATRSSGRIGRSAAGRVLDADAASLAVAASVRVDTGYDQLLMSGVDREAARQQVRGQVEDVLGGWRATIR